MVAHLKLDVVGNLKMANVVADLKLDNVVLVANLKLDVVADLKLANVANVVVSLKQK